MRFDFYDGSLANQWNPSELIVEMNNKKLTDEEHKKYTEFMLKNINYENIKEKVNDMESIKQKIDKIDSKVKYIINLIPNYFDVESTDLMKIVLDEYEKEIDKLHKKIQKRCEELDEIDDMRYKEKLIKTLTAYGSNNIRNKK